MAKIVGAVVVVGVIGAGAAFVTRHHGPSRLYVDVDAAQGGNGKSWDSAMNSLHAAIRTARKGTEIWVASGTYYADNGTGDPDKHFFLKNEMSIIGGFEGTESSPDERDLSNNETILSGDIGVRGDDSDNSVHVMTSGQRVDHGVLDGLVFQAGRSDRFAGGLLNFRASLQIKNCVFRDNKAYAGGGMFNRYGECVFTDCLWENNYAVVRGGGIYTVENSSHFIRCTFKGNTCDEGGAGICTVGHEPIFDECVFIENVAGERGAGLCNIIGVCTINDCVFEHNISPRGAGFYHDSGFAHVSRCIFKNNESSDYSAGIVLVNGFVDINDCVFESNVSGGGGVALHNVRGKPILNRCEFSNNQSQSDEGGLVWSGPKGVVRYFECTFAEDASSPRDAGPGTFTVQTEGPAEVYYSSGADG